MSYEEARSHAVTMQDRKRLTISGVEAVDSYDDREIVMKTCLGSLTVKGQDMKLDGLSTQTGDVTITGQVNSMVYDDVSTSGSVWSRLFK